VVGCADGSREVPGERKLVIRHDNDKIMKIAEIISRNLDSVPYASLRY
jgi:hypothetical protein